MVFSNSYLSSNIN